MLHVSGKAMRFKFFVISGVIPDRQRIISGETASEGMSKRSSLYLHPQQRNQIHRLASGFLWRSELPTWLLMFTIYAGWFATLAFWQTLGLLPATLLLIGFTAWYMSLQHELIHGHPTRFAWLNQLFGTLPLAVWYPYGLYRDSHLAHHRHHSLTHPVDDPESYYFTDESWARFSPWQKRTIRARLGRGESRLQVIRFGQQRRERRLQGVNHGPVAFIRTAVKLHLRQPGV